MNEVSLKKLELIQRASVNVPLDYNAHLADDVPVRETDNHPVLRCVVLVLILYDQALAGKKVSLSLWNKHTLQVSNK